MKNWYLKYVIKKPYLYFCFILIGITVILSLLVITTVPVVSTYSVELNDNQEGCFLSCDESIFSSDIKSIFLYSDKNDVMYQITSYIVINNKQINVTQDLSCLISHADSKEYYIDISKDTITLLDEIFVQGGKN